MFQRKLRVTMALALSALALAACGGNDSDDEASSGGETKTVESTFTGEKVQVPTEPKRIVALWRTGSELADLGVVPVASLEGEFLEEELGAEVYAGVKDVPTVGSFEGVDVQKVIAAKPDLIIGMDNGGLSIDYDELAEVAPTVILKIAEPTDVWDNYPAVADIVGKSTDYETKNADLDRQLAQIKSEFGDVVGSLEVTSLGAYEGQLYVDTSKSLTYRRLEAAGFGYNPQYTDDPERYSAELSMENLPDLEGQDALFYDTNLDGSVSPDNQKLLDAKSWQALPAAKQGFALPLASGTIYTFAGAQAQVDDLRAAAEKLAAK